MDVNNPGTAATKDDTDFIEEMLSQMKARLFTKSLDPTIEDAVALLFEELAVTNAILRQTRREHNEELAALRLELQTEAHR